MQCWGVSPSAYAAGERRQQGSITQAGTTQARRALGAGAWASRDPATVSRQLPLRRETPPQVIQGISWKAHVRLCTRDRRLGAQGKPANGVTVAMARELVGFLGAIAKAVPVTP
jgi:transposase